jgi:lactate racemase
MRVPLAYGDHGVEVNLPDSSAVLTSPAFDALDNVPAAVADAMGHPRDSLPLRDLVRANDVAAIVVSDITRPVPNNVLLPPALGVLRDCGVPRENIAIIIGTGMHRASTPDERVRIVGPEIAASYDVIDHDARDTSSLAHLTTTSRGIDVSLNKRYLDADVKIVVGFVEPHLFAGYSGGGKGIVPGIAGTDIVMSNHGADMLAHPKATWCTTDGNPIFEEQRDLALLSRPSFALQVTLNERREVTGVFAGELVAAHEAGILQAERQHIREVPHAFDIVVSTNMGYPADLNFYQSVKGMSVAAQAVKEGGAIILAAECREGLGLSDYTDLLRSEDSPGALLDRIMSADPPRYDQWQVQIQAMVQAKADVWLHSSLARADVESAHVRYCEDVSRTVEELRAHHVASFGEEPSILVLPHGQLTVPRLAPAS